MPTSLCRSLLMCGASGVGASWSGERQRIAAPASKVQRRWSRWDRGPTATELCFRRIDLHFTAVPGYQVAPWQDQMTNQAYWYSTHTLLDWKMMSPCFFISTRLLCSGTLLPCLFASSRRVLNFQRRTEAAKAFLSFTYIWPHAPVM